MEKSCNAAPKTFGRDQAVNLRSLRFGLGPLTIGSSELFESLASCFAFRCSAPQVTHEETCRHSNFLMFQRSNIPQIVDRLATVLRKLIPHADSSLTGYSNRPKFPCRAGPHCNSRGSRDFLRGVILRGPGAGKPCLRPNNSKHGRAHSSGFADFGLLASASGSAANGSCTSSGNFACSIAR